jgi:TIR domain
VSDIFVSYRKADAAFGAAATYELLVNRFGRARIFLDHQSMGPGSLYPQRLRAALKSMRVLIVFIGPQWLAGDPRSSGRLLIHRDNDWVRREIRTALARTVPIIPVLLDEASLPAPEVLPEDIRALVQYQRTEVRHRQLRADVDRLADAIDGLLVSASVQDSAGKGMRPELQPLPDRIAALNTAVPRFATISRFLKRPRAVASAVTILLVAAVAAYMALSVMNDQTSPTGEWRQIIDVGPNGVTVVDDSGGSRELLAPHDLRYADDSNLVATYGIRRWDQDSRPVLQSRFSGVWSRCYLS